MRTEDLFRHQGVVFALVSVFDNLDSNIERLMAIAELLHLTVINDDEGGCSKTATLEHLADCLDILNEEPTPEPEPVDRRGVHGLERKRKRGYGDDRL